MYLFSIPYLILLEISDISDSQNPMVLSDRFLKPDQNNITFVHLTERDSMCIQCNASNKHGYVFTDVFLSVKGIDIYIFHSSLCIKVHFVKLKLTDLIFSVPYAQMHQFGDCYMYIYRVWLIISGVQNNTPYMWMDMLGFICIYSAKPRGKGSKPSNYSKWKKKSIKSTISCFVWWSVPKQCTCNHNQFDKSVVTLWFYSYHIIL